MGRRNTENNDRRTEQFRKLFIGGLTPQTDEIRLRKYYEQWGELVDFVVMKDNKTGRSRGFGFVTYRDPEMVDEAQNNRPHEVDGKIVEAKRAMPREDSNTPESHMTVNKLFVGGLKKDVTTEHLRHYFTSYGTITDCEIVTWKDSGESRGFGFVTFDDYDPVDKAILYKPHQIGSSRVDVKKALSKDEMEEIRRKQHNEPLSVNCSTSSDYFQNTSKSTIPAFQSPIQQNTYSSNLPCVGSVMFDGSFQATGYQYPNISASNWNGNPGINSNYMYSRPISDLNQFVAPSVINFNNLINPSQPSPVDNGQQNIDACDISTKTKISSTGDENI
uniref:Heterogeneous nuclear ribonucleoprotein A2 n=1 Tax=Schmidtea mediterranea TaxID=79327 RepID=E2IXG0_SCHMD|nr:heterogeneous nuclear ribonucleoprotein A2 [Schmidtea mediterranea]